MIRNQRVTISLILGLLGAIVGTLHGVWTYKASVREAGERFRREAPTVAMRVVGQLTGLIVDLPSNDHRKEQQRILSELVRDDPRILFAALIDQFQQVSVKAELPKGVELASLDTIPLDLSLQDILRDRAPNVFSEAGEYYQPILATDDTLWGQLRLVWNQEPFRKNLNAIIRRTVIVSIAAFLMTAMITFFVHGRLVLGDMDRLMDMIERIVTGGTRGRLEPSIMAVDMLPLVTQINRLLEDHEDARKRVLLLEDSLRQSESSYQDYKSRMGQVSESIEREKSMAMLAFYELFENTGDGIVVCDNDGEVSGANRPARRWLGLRDTQGEKVSDRALLSMVQRLTRDGGDEDAECVWTYRDPIDGQGRQARVYAALLERRDGDQGVVLIHILPERSRRGASGPLERLYARLTDEMVVPLLVAISQGKSDVVQNGHAVRLEELVLWAHRLRRLSEIESSYAGGRSEAAGPERFDLGPWLAKQLQAPDLFAEELTIRLYPPEVAALVAVPLPMMTLALDGLVAFLHESGPGGKRRSRSSAQSELVEWVVRLQRDGQQRAELIITPTGDFKTASVAHLSILREATETVRPSQTSFAERLTCRQEIALTCFLTAQTMIGSGLRVTPSDRKTPPVVHWVFPHPDHVNNKSPGVRRLHPRTGGVDSMIERFFGR